MLVSHRGFTLMEMLIVMAIVGMLVAMVGPTIMNQFSNTQPKAARAQMGMIETSLAAHRLDTSSYPSSLDGLIKNSTNKPSWKGAYIKPSQLLDPWGEKFKYKSPGSNGRDFDLYSLGADKKDGGEGNNADLKNWE